MYCHTLPSMSATPNGLRSPGEYLGTNVRTIVAKVRAMGTNVVAMGMKLANIDIKA